MQADKAVLLYSSQSIYCVPGPWWGDSWQCHPQVEHS
jgi:hypothetical protein